MKILIIPDSFKGSMTSTQVAHTIKRAIKDNSNHQVITLPFADGGEGFIEAFCGFSNAKIRKCECHNIYNQPMEGHIAVLGDTAIVECAIAGGMQKRRQVMLSSSYGTGELIRFAINEGYRKIILALGGTGTCDGGMGIISALGGIFYNEQYNEIRIPKSQDMNFIFGVNFRDMPRDISFTYACDVENPFYGKDGAAYVFAVQKGANQTQVQELDEGLKRLNAFLPRDISSVKGAGAAGGICGGLYSIFGGKIRSGFDILCEYADLEEQIKKADVIITGEGKTDNQTLMGKLPYKIAMLCKKHKKKCIVISGKIEDIRLGDYMISLTDDSISVEQAMNECEEILYKKVQNSLEIIGK